MGKTIITIKNDGSIRVEGDDFEIVDIEGRPFGIGDRTKVSLCRCGLSEKKPFCDGSHKGRFASHIEAFDL